ncbi:putative membrane protein [Neomicrococcus aestuarii]|uniref:Putative membrane protein n=2 Tax=Neomicrococcus aestuarii TaxID=556325 RepID=A0A7W8TXA3_9MICC|nr:putative membrane protein [Neomicrococcus aestuarii]
MAERTPIIPVDSKGLDTPMKAKERFLPRFSPNPDAFGSATEKFARFMGTPSFLVWMTIFCIVWIIWNTVMPEPVRFDSAALGFTALTLMLSLQASYAAPLLLLAQNRQDDRDRVSVAEDRQRAERNLSDTEYLTRELAALRIALRDVATRDYVRSELRSVLEELIETSDGEEIRLRSKSKKKDRDPQTTTIKQVKPKKKESKPENDDAAQLPEAASTSEGVQNDVVKTEVDKNEGDAV